MVLRGYTVKQVAKLSGVSVRALHHYDEIGLLKPDSVGANGYRYYGREELLRLQQILFHRELGFSLEEIGKVLDAADFDRVAALRRHRERLEADAKRYRQLVKTIDQTLAALKGDETMDDKEMYRGFDPKKQAEHEAWIADKYGADTVAASKTAMKGWGASDFQAMQADFDRLEAAMARALTEGLPASSPPVQDLMGSWAAWIGKTWGRAPTGEAFAGLGQLYQSQPDFRARYDGRAPGLTDYLAEAMRIYGETQLA